MVRTDHVTLILASHWSARCLHVYLVTIRVSCGEKSAETGVITLVMMMMMMMMMMMIVIMTVRADPALDSYQGKQNRLA